MKEARARRTAANVSELSRLVRNTGAQAAGRARAAGAAGPSTAFGPGSAGYRERDLCVCFLHTGVCAIAQLTYVCACVVRTSRHATGAMWSEASPARCSRYVAALGTFVCVKGNVANRGDGPGSALAGR